MGTSYPGMEVGIRHKLKFDFDIDLGEGEHLIIEYDGQQHSHNTLKSGNIIRRRLATSPVDRQIELDEMKNKFCQQNPKFHLHRISYKDHTERKLMEILNLYFETDGTA